eukprot:13275229-Alexandrium_andersonii.AAC.1
MVVRIDPTVVNTLANMPLKPVAQAACHVSTTIAPTISGVAHARTHGLHTAKCEHASALPGGVRSLTRA